MMRILPKRQRLQRQLFMSEQFCNPVVDLVAYRANLLDAPAHGVRKGARSSRGRPGMKGHSSPHPS